MSNNRRFIKKYSAALVFAAAFTMLSGCGKCELTSSEVTLELGTKLSVDPRSYVMLDNEAEYDNVSFDIAAVDTNHVGSYTATVSYKNDSYEISVLVVDTTAPVFTAEDFFVVPVGTELFAEDILKDVSDLSEVTCILSNVTKVGEVGDYQDSFVLSDVILDETELNAVSGKLMEEGIYELTAYAVDAEGNRAGANALVIVDGTAPELIVNGTELEVDASAFTTEATDINEVLNALHELSWNIDVEAVDNYKMSEDGVSYVITASEADVSGTDLVEHVTLTYTLCDAVGNTADQEVELLVTYAGLDAKTIGKQTGLIVEKVAPTAVQTSKTNKGQNNTSGSSLQQSNATISGNNEDETPSGTGLTLVGYSVGGVWHDASDAMLDMGYKADYALEIFGYINQARAEAGLNQLVWDSDMAELANVRALEITELFSHDRPDGSRVSKVYGYGENCTYGTNNPADVHNGFMDSEGHRANILREGITRGAVGAYQGEYQTLYVVELFAY